MEQYTATRKRLLSASLACISMLGLAGCRQDMQDQPKFFPQRGTDFYADGRSSRPQVVGTVARGQEDAGSYFRTGMVNGVEGDGLPVPLTSELVARGQERYNIYCAVCHSRVGNGKGMIVMRGYFAAGDLQRDRMRTAPLGHFFSVISNGYGAMPEYSGQIEPEDRWAIAAYIRALQLSQRATVADAGGAPIQTIADVEKKEGLAADFIKDWELPQTSGVREYQTMPASAAVPVASPAANPKVAPLTLAVPAGAKPTPATAAAAAVEAKASAPSAAAPHATAGSAANGEKLYQANCSVCHQPTRTGLPPAIPSLVGVVARVGAEHIHHQVANGSKSGAVQMPPFPQLSTAQVDDIIAFLAAAK
jgi:mono/diheme cytochrome c family protein